MYYISTYDDILLKLTDSGVVKSLINLNLYLNKSNTGGNILFNSL